LARSLARSGFSLRVDEVANAFGLGEIDPAVRQSAKCELAGAGSMCAEG